MRDGPVPAAGYAGQLTLLPLARDLGARWRLRGQRRRGQSAHSDVQDPDRELRVKLRVN